MKRLLRLYYNWRARHRASPEQAERARAEARLAWLFHEQTTRNARIERAVAEKNIQPLLEEIGRPQHVQHLRQIVLVQITLGELWHVRLEAWRDSLRLAKWKN